MLLRRPGTLATEGGPREAQGERSRPQPRVPSNHAVAPELPLGADRGGSSSDTGREGWGQEDDAPQPVSQESKFFFPFWGLPQNLRF